MPNLSTTPAARPVIVAPQPTTATAAPSAACFFGQLQAQLPASPGPGQSSPSNPVPLTPPTTDVKAQAPAQAPAGDLKPGARERVTRPVGALNLSASAPVAQPATPLQPTPTTTAATPPDPAGATPPAPANNTDPQRSADDPPVVAKSANAAATMLPVGLTGVSTDPTRDTGRPRSKPGSPAPSTDAPATHAQPQLDASPPQPAAAASPPAASAAPLPAHAQPLQAADPALANPSPQSSAAQPASVELRRTKVAAVETPETTPATPAETAPPPAAPAPLAATPPPTHLTGPALLQSAAASTSQPSPPAAPPPPAVQVAQAIANPIHVVLASPSQQSGGAHVTTIQLDPIELGRVEIRIERTGDGPAKIELAAERPDTLLRLIHDQPQLQQALDQAGIPQQGRTITFSLAPDNGAAGSSFANSTGDGNAGGNPQRSQHAYGNPNGAAAEAAGSLVSIPVWSKTGLDITA